MGGSLVGFLEAAERRQLDWVARRMRADYWSPHTQFSFEVSPPGNGLDCFRTRDSWVLGAIPIVRTSPLDQLYREHDLPVAIDSKAAEITEAILKCWNEELAPLLGKIESQLSYDYLTSLIRDKTRNLSHPRLR